MIELEQQLCDIFRRRSETARPDPDLLAVKNRAPRLSVATEPAPSPPRRLVAVAAALVVLAGLGATVYAYRTRLATESPSTHVTYPAGIPPAPEASTAQMSAIARHFYALDLDGTSLRLNTGTRHDLLTDIESGAPADSPWRRWTPASGSIVDSDGTTPAAFYLVTCCTPGGVIWRNGVQLTTGTHIDYLLSPGVVERVTLDAATSTITQDVGDPATTVVESGAIDVALLDARTMGVLVGGAAPKLVITTKAGATRQEVALPSGSVEPCALVALQDRFVVLVGAPRGNDPCVGDRALIVDGVTGHITATLRMPAQLRRLNSDHSQKVIAVTVEGNVVLGDFSNSPRWITLLNGDYLSAGMW